MADWTGWATTSDIQALMPNRVLTIAAGSEPTTSQVEDWIVKESLYVNARIHENLSTPTDFDAATFSAWVTANPNASRILEHVTALRVAAQCLQLKFPRDDIMAFQWRNMFEQAEEMLQALETGSAEPGDGADTKSQVATQQVDVDDSDAINAFKINTFNY